MNSGFCIYHLFVWSNSNFLHNSYWIIFLTQTCHYYYYFTSCGFFMLALLGGLPLELERQQAPSGLQNSFSVFRTISAGFWSGWSPFFRWPIIRPLYFLSLGRPFRTCYYYHHRNLHDSQLFRLLSRSNYLQIFSISFIFKLWSIFKN